MVGKYSRTGVCFMGTPQLVLHQGGPAGFLAGGSHLLSTYYVLDSILRAICSFTHLRLTATLYSGDYYYLSHFTCDETVAQREATFPGALLIT